MQQECANARGNSGNKEIAFLDRVPYQIQSSIYRYSVARGRDEGLYYRSWESRFHTVRRCLN